MDVFCPRVLGTGVRLWYAIKIVEASVDDFLPLVA